MSLERTPPGEDAPAAAPLRASVSSSAQWGRASCGGLTEVAAVQSGRQCRMEQSRAGQGLLVGFGPTRTAHPPLTWSPHCLINGTLSPSTVSDSRFLSCPRSPASGRGEAPASLPCGQPAQSQCPLAATSPPASQAPPAHSPDWVPGRGLPPSSQLWITDGTTEISQQASFPLVPGAPP